MAVNIPVIDIDFDIDFDIDVDVADDFDYIICG